MKIKRSETGTYFVEPVCDEDVRFMDALMVAVDAFEKAYYPMILLKERLLLLVAHRLIALNQINVTVVICDIHNSFPRFGGVFTSPAHPSMPRSRVRQSPCPSPRRSP